MKKGKLYIISTPIGNLDDITKRAVNILKKVEIILAEDTRKTRKLLTHLGIKNQSLLSYYEGRKWERIPKVIKSLQAGKNVGLVTDAGSPLISDPGYQLVQSALEQNFKVVPIPGPSAVITALMAAGLPCNKFIFLGYLPKKDKKIDLIRSIWDKSSAVKTIVFYESPQRLIITLKLIRINFGEVKVSIAREMTKKHEEFIRGDIKKVIENLKEKEIKGEVTVVMSLD